MHFFVAIFIRLASMPNRSTLRNAFRLPKTVSPSESDPG